MRWEALVLQDSSRSLPKQSVARFHILSHCLAHCLAVRLWKWIYSNTSFTRLLFKVCITNFNDMGSKVSRPMHHLAQAHLSDLYTCLLNDSVCPVGILNSIYPNLSSWYQYHRQLPSLFPSSFSYLSNSTPKSKALVFSMFLLVSIPFMKSYQQILVLSSVSSLPLLLSVTLQHSHWS